MSRVDVRWAREEDLPSIKRLADANRAALGFVRLAALRESMQTGELLAAVRSTGEVVGFARFHVRRDRQMTLYDIASKSRGAGRELVVALQLIVLERGETCVLARCPVDNASNAFYPRLGFTCIAQETGKNRALNVWRWLPSRMGAHQGGIEGDGQRWR